MREGVHIWIPGPEPTFFPCECEELGSRERAVRRQLASIPLPCNKTHPGRKTGRAFKAQNLILGYPTPK